MPHLFIEMLEAHQTASDVQCWLEEQCPASRSTSDSPLCYRCSCEVFIPPEQRLSRLHSKQAGNVLSNIHFLSIDQLVANCAWPGWRCLCSFNWFSINVWRTRYLSDTSTCQLPSSIESEWAFIRVLRIKNIKGDFSRHCSLDFATVA